MKIQSPVHEHKARIEIIPLIDIMFFLLVSFMAVSLSMVQMHGVGVNLPEVTNTQPELSNDLLAITVERDGAISLEKEPMGKEALFTRLELLARQNRELRVYIRADENVTHGTVLSVMDTVRSAGVKKVAFEVKARSGGAPAQASEVPAPSPAAAPNLQPTKE